MKYRVSHVDAFRQWGADEDYELGTLLSRLRGEDQPSPAMIAGTAFHKALELSPTGIDAESIGANGHRFTFAGDFDIELAPVRELRANKVYTVDGEPITITGQVDAIVGLRIEDHKTTSRFDPDRYLAGYQWRLYLDIFGASVFRWNVFEMAEIAAEFNSGEIAYEVFAAHRLEQYRYPALGSDCQALVERFARFVREHLEVAA